MSGQDCDEAPLPGSYEVTAHLGLRYCVAISNTSRQILRKAYLPVSLRVRHDPRWPNCIIAVSLPSPSSHGARASVLVVWTAPRRPRSTHFDRLLPVIVNSMKRFKSWRPS